MAGNWKALGNAIRARREARGWTQPELAKFANVSESTVRNIERATGKHRHRRGTVEPILRALRMPPEDYDDLLGSSLEAEVAEQHVDNATLLSSMAALQERLDQLGVILEQRLGGVVDIIHNSDSDVDITIEIKHHPRQ